MRTAELLSIGTELTSGDTLDTNARELASDLTGRGLRVLRLVALPDDLAIVTDALEAALARAELVVTTGGLGPTPDDLTREAIAAACGERPTVDAALEAWLRELFERRGSTMSERNRKQAWLIPSARALPNRHGTAPGWWVERPGGRVVVALPGPPREMRPMWRDEVVPRLSQRGVGVERASTVLRLAGIGESAAADLIGDGLLGSAEPSVATYFRADSVDVRVVAQGPGAADRLASTTAALEARLAPYVFARDGEGWVDALGRRLEGRSLATLEIGTGGALAALIGGASWFARGEVAGPAAAAARGDIRRLATAAREGAGVEVGLAVRARPSRGDTAVAVGIATPAGVERRMRTAFLTGEEGRRRAALAACLELWLHLGSPPGG